MMKICTYMHIWINNFMSVVPTRGFMELIGFLVSTVPWILISWTYLFRNKGRPFTDNAMTAGHWQKDIYSPECSWVSDRQKRTTFQTVSWRLGQQATFKRCFTHICNTVAGGLVSILYQAICNSTFGVYLSTSHELLMSELYLQRCQLPWWRCGNMVPSCMSC